MTAIEELISVVRKGYNSEYSDVNEFLIALLDAFEAFEEDPQEWVPPWPARLPDGEFAKELWFAVDEDGMGKWYDMEPEQLEHCFAEPFDGIFEHAGLFRIPDGEDWRNSRMRVR